MIYWETSALVKQFVREPGSGQTLALRAQDPPHATATITYPEIVSALRRRVREGFLSEVNYRSALDHFKRDWPAFVRIRAHEELFEKAARLIERHPLRTLDAIHLAAALQLQQEVVEPSLVVSADNQLLKAASAEHLTTRRIEL